MKDFHINLIQFIEQTNKLFSQGLTYNDLPEEVKEKLSSFFRGLETFEQRIEDAEKALQTIEDLNKRILSLENKLKSAPKTSDNKQKTKEV